ncbi:PTS transporter subunit EIIB [Pseudomonas sp. CDFA 602]|uniref:PTS transporter subunit EIIB n=1 Tax=Pseudomonas californiensis TaxID=2829823 RepID=UPI001E61DAE6|nr:PTS transporter subunit EIIB [Pseudomonas californiensis]MCD5996350.1 PTS transporter subunit EIIB [Pseudomonas californiensis]MCD6001949.1 PTS transporter subunit EIIB [Pseudomonas californiensis]
MLSKLQSAFWKALTPDLVPDEPKVAAIPEILLPAKVVSALGGAENLALQQRVALTRIRVQLHDAARLDETALKASGMPPVMVLANGVIHVLTPISAALSETG